MELPDGRYTVGFRPNHLEIDRHTDGAIRFECKLAVTEITGSETFIHLDHAGERWVGLIHGVRELEIGSDITVFLDPSHIYTFAPDGRLAAAASYAMAA
jgi:glycerol transport system ATP-binding protein